jgi:hypothetical protein
MTVDIRPDVETYPEVPIPKIVDCSCDDET